MCTAQFDYAANQTGQLSLKVGDRIGILSRAGGFRGWWKGSLNGKVRPWSSYLFQCTVLAFRRRATFLGDLCWKMMIAVLDGSCAPYVHRRWWTKALAPFLCWQTSYSFGITLQASCVICWELTVDYFLQSRPSVVSSIVCILYNVPMPCSATQRLCKLCVATACTACSRIRWLSYLYGDQSIKGVNSLLFLL
jgi:hypothetical protein